MSDQNSTIIDVLQQQFVELEKQMNGATNTEAHMARKSAFGIFKEIGLPGRKDEEYRYTPLAKQLEKDFDGFVANPDIGESTLAKIQLPELSGTKIVFVNGVYQEALSNIATLNGAEINIASSQKDLMKITSLNLSSNDAFSGLNLALASSGVSIRVAKNAVIEESIHIIHITNSDASCVMATPRHEITIGENAQATIAEIFIGTGAQSSFTNSAMDISIANNGLLNHYKVGMDGDNNLRIDNTNCYQQNNSVLNTINMNFGGKIIRNNLNIILQGEYCESNLDGLYLPIADGNIDNHTVVDHTMPNSNSNELYKGIIGENATAVFNGKVFVRKDAQKTNAFQSNKNILLSDSSTINTKPQLEIWADDVKCSHGCTTGQMDKEQLFYLRARGIDERSAQKLLLNAFAEEVILKIKDEKIKELVEGVLEEKINK